MTIRNKLMALRQVAFDSLDLEMRIIAYKGLDMPLLLKLGKLINNIDKEITRLRRLH
jgi:hypothetical protein